MGLKCGGMEMMRKILQRCCFFMAVMKKQQGFTLIELMVTVAIVTILLVYAAVNYRLLNGKLLVESDVKELSALLMRARSDAANSNAQVRVTIAANSVTVHHDMNNNGAVDTFDADNDGVNETTEPSPVNRFSDFTINSNLGVPQTIVFDRRGMTNDWQTLSMTYAPQLAPKIDCVVIAATRINIGKIDGGGNCVQ